MRPLLGLGLLSHLLPVFAETESTCGTACRKCFQSVVFSPAGPGESKFEQSCRNRLALSSSYLCFHLNCGAEARDAALAALNASCQEILRTPIPPFSLVEDYSADDIARLRRINKNDSFGSDDPLDEVVLPSADFFRVWNDTLVSLDPSSPLLASATTNRELGCRCLCPQIPLPLWVSSCCVPATVLRSEEC